jgi:RHS repeat-associated protein
VALMPDLWTQAWRRNAQAEVEWERSADGSEILYGNHLNGWLAKLDMLQPGESTSQAAMLSQNYDAAGARQTMRLANGVETRFSYDPATQRTVGIRSTRNTGLQTLQDLGYVYDPVGNVTSESDGVQTVAYRGGLAIDPIRRFVYDAVYRLISATGRQTVADHPDQLQNYQRHYRYDLSGNLIRLQSVNADSTPGFTRDFAVAARSNRSVPANMLAGGKRPEDFFDAAGNLQSLLQPLPDPELSALEYDYRNTLTGATILPRVDGDDDRAYFLYDDGRQRARKVVERRVSGGTRGEDTLYIGNVAIVRENLQGIAREQETVTLRLVAGPQCVLVTRCVRAMPGGAESERTYRYQLDDHLGSVALEVDETAGVITYEEYYPYGGAAVIGGTSTVEVERKRYRFSGKELDQATSLYYFGQRYYVPWMARWLTPDPAGPADGINLFLYAYDNPTTFIDPTGNNGVTPEERASWLLRVDQQYRYLTPSEFQSNVVLSWDEHQEIHKNSLLFADESARFSPAVENRLLDAFRSVDSLFFFNNPVLAEAWDDANSRITHPSKTLDLRHDYTLTRSHLNNVLSVDIPELDFSNFLTPFESHHSLLKSFHPELATTTEIMALATRGSTSSGLVGQHEGLFHLLTAAQMGSTFATEVPAVSGLIKRSIADSLSLDITDTTALQTAGYGWLELEDRSKGGTVKLWSLKKPDPPKLAKRKKTQTERVNKIVKRNRDTSPYSPFDSTQRKKLQTTAKKSKYVAKAGKSTFTFTFN